MGNIHYWSNIDAMDCAPCQPGSAERKLYSLSCAEKIKASAFDIAITACGITDQSA